MTWLAQTIAHRNFAALKLGFATYVLAAPLVHATIDVRFVWTTAFVFLALMLFTYPITAIWRGEYRGLELSVSSTLLALGALGLVATPLFLVAAIALHGVWDFAKHRGVGTPFFSWYTLGCAAFDWVYVTALLIFFFNI